MYPLSDYSVLFTNSFVFKNILLLEAGVYSILKTSRTYRTSYYYNVFLNGGLTFNKIHVLGSFNYGDNLYATGYPNLDLMLRYKF